MREKNKWRVTRLTLKDSCLFVDSFPSQNSWLEVSVLRLTNGLAQVVFFGWEKCVDEALPFH